MKAWSLWRRVGSTCFLSRSWLPRSLKPSMVKSWECWFLTWYPEQIRLLCSPFMDCRDQYMQFQPPKSVLIARFALRFLPIRKISYSMNLLQTLTFNCWDGWPTLTAIQTWTAEQLGLSRNAFIWQWTTCVYPNDECSKGILESLRKRAHIMTDGFNSCRNVVCNFTEGKPFLNIFPVSCA